MLLGIEIPFNSKCGFDLISGSLCCFPLANISWALITEVLEELKTSSHPRV